MKNKRELANFLAKKMCLENPEYIYDMLVEFEKSELMVLLILTKNEAKELSLVLESILSAGGNKNLQSIADKLN